MTFTPDQSQLNALKTWNDKGDSIRHATLGLTGEAGELIELFKKHEYKPGFDWWNCKHCKTYYKYDDLSQQVYNWSKCNCKNYTPLILDELGDFSYYLRILAYQKWVSFEELCLSSSPSKRITDLYDLLYWLAQLNKGSDRILNEWVSNGSLSLGRLSDCVYRFQCILSKLDTPLETVLDLNYKKLNSEATNHGWRNAKMKTIDDCPPMNPK